MILAYALRNRIYIYLAYVLRNLTLSVAAVITIAILADFRIRDIMIGSCITLLFTLWAYFMHRMLHDETTCERNSLLRYLSRCHAYLHHGGDMDEKPRSWSRRILHVTTDTVFELVGWGGLVLPALWGVTLLRRIGVAFVLIYNLTHRAMHLKGDRQHQRHHDDPHTNFAPALMDLLCGTAGPGYQEVPDENYLAPLLLIVAVIVRLAL